MRHGSDKWIPYNAEPDIDWRGRRRKCSFYLTTLLSSERGTRRPFDRATNGHPGDPLRSQVVRRVIEGETASVKDGLLLSTLPMRARPDMPTMRK